MTPLDWILLAVLLGSTLLGALRGLVFEVLSVLGWLAAFVLAQWFAPEVAAWLPMGQASGTMRFAAGFVLVFVVAAFAGGLVASLIRRLVQAVGLRPVDRILGMVFGALRGVILLLAGAAVAHFTSMDQSDWWQSSRGAAIASDALQTVRPMLPEEFAKFLP